MATLDVPLSSNRQLMSLKTTVVRHHFVALLSHRWDAGKSPGGYSLRRCIRCGKHQVGHHGTFNAAEPYWMTAKPGTEFFQNFFPEET